MLSCVISSVVTSYLQIKHHSPSVLISCAGEYGPTKYSSGKAMLAVAAAT